MRRREKGERGRERGGDREREREMRWREMRCVMLYRGEKRERSGRDLFPPSFSPSLSLPCQRKWERERERGRRERR